MSVKMMNRAGDVLAVLPFETADAAANAIALALATLGSGYAIHAEPNKAELQVGHRHLYLERIDSLEGLAQAITQEGPADAVV